MGPCPVSLGVYMNISILKNICITIFIFTSYNTAFASPIDTAVLAKSPLNMGNHLSPKSPLSPTNSRNNTNIAANTTIQWLPAAPDVKNLTRTNLEVEREERGSSLTQVPQQSEELDSSGAGRIDIRGNGILSTEKLFYKSLRPRIQCPSSSDEPQILARISRVFDGDYNIPGASPNDLDAFKRRWSHIRKNTESSSRRLVREAINICMKCSCNKINWQLVRTSFGAYGAGGTTRTGCGPAHARYCNFIYGCYCMVELLTEPTDTIRRLRLFNFNRLQELALRIPDRIRNSPANAGVEWRVPNTTGPGDVVLRLGAPLPSNGEADLPSLTPPTLGEIFNDPNDPGEGSSTGVTRSSHFGQVNVAPSTEPPFYLSGPTDEDFFWRDYYDNPGGFGGGDGGGSGFVKREMVSNEEDNISSRKPGYL
ncbi:hypothetical protein TWF970_009491 [Orbilia oligospora]|uniref:Uncharacterized protein n=1 Tax=Orbilia oligospora TaxID=2813651 RepID=A0A7C8VE95_ORBOL|nr:hypothetical protein TWF970_009491 [Orbilia oligospora]